MNPKTELLKLTAIDTTVAALVREKLDEDVVTEYAAAMIADEPDIFPPVVVFRDGKTNFLADGRHRYEAAKRAHLLAIAAIVTPGTREDAELHASSANATNGLRRSPGDKRLAVGLFLRDPIRAKFSDREISRRCHVSQPFVSGLRAKARVIKADNVITPNVETVLPWHPPEGMNSVGTIRSSDGGIRVAWIVPAVLPEGENQKFFWSVIVTVRDGDDEDGDVTYTKRPIPFNIPAFESDVIGHTLRTAGFAPEDAEWEHESLTDEPDGLDGLAWNKRWSWPHLAFRSKQEWREHTQWWAFPRDSETYQAGAEREGIKFPVEPAS